MTRIQQPMKTVEVQCQNKFKALQEEEREENKTQKIDFVFQNSELDLLPDFRPNK